MIRLIGLGLGVPSGLVVRPIMEVFQGGDGSHNTAPAHPILDTPFDASAMTCPFTAVHTRPLLSLTFPERCQKTSNLNHSPMGTVALLNTSQKVSRGRLPATLSPLMFQQIKAPPAHLVTTEAITR